MTLPELLNELKTRNNPLYWFGWVNIAILVAAFILFFIDPTVITGINAWIKPMKFSLSIVIYSWTFAWLLHYLPAAGSKKIISWGIIICMLVENSLIFIQAARGVRSHFNVSSAFDGIIFSAMGFFILINTFIILYTIILFFSKRIVLETTLLWAWRAGLIFFFLGGISGGYMSAVLHHTMGGEDGGPGLPFLNWSTLFGDVRSAHFVTLHGLQAIPLAALVFIKSSKENAKSLVLIFSFIYFGICLWLHWLAFNGLPLISIP